MAAFDEGLSYLNQAKNKAIGVQKDCTNAINRFNIVAQQIATKDAMIVALNETITGQDSIIEGLQADIVLLNDELDAKTDEIVALIADNTRLLASLTACEQALDELGQQEPPPPPPPPEFWQGLNTDWASIKAGVGPRIATVAASGGNVSGFIQGYRFTGTVYPADGTEFEDCEFIGNGGWGIDGNGKRFTVRNCRFISTNGGPAAILGNATVERCDISGFEDGIKTQGDGWVVRGNWIHDPWFNQSSHNDAVQVQLTNSNGLIEMNVLEWRDTSEVFLQELTGQISNITVRWNLMQGSDLPLRIEGGTENCKAYENAIKKGYWGYFDLASNVEHYGNIDAVTGAAID